MCVLHQELGSPVRLPHRALLSCIICVPGLKVCPIHTPHKVLLWVSLTQHLLKMPDLKTYELWENNVPWLLAAENWPSAEGLVVKSQPALAALVGGPQKQQG